MSYETSQIFKRRGKEATRVGMQTGISRFSEIEKGNKAEKSGNGNIHKNGNIWNTNGRRRL